MEIWKQHPRISDIYEFSNYGNFRRSDTKQELKKSLYNGYVITFLLTKDESKRIRVKIHRMVAELFIANPLNKATVNHKDGNKFNNHFSNLEWLTNQENIAHSIDTGLRKRSHAQKLTENEIREIRKIFDTQNVTITELGRRYKVVSSSIKLLLIYKSYPNIDSDKKNDYKINTLTGQELIDFINLRPKRKYITRSNNLS